MRFFYFLLHVLVKYPMRIYYPRQVFINKPKGYLNRTIYVSNHAASFMDPLVLGSLQRPSVFFMTRSDVFTKFTRPLLSSIQMLPIYRQHDGEDTKKKNEEVFLKVNRILSSGRNLLIFGEGFTDDVYIRRLKPLKKGAVRMGFDTLVKSKWEKKIYIATIGINYGDPNVIGSDLLVSNGLPLCLNDYRIDYENNDSKTINDITFLVEKDLQNQLTHVENVDWVFFHEHVIRLLRTGLHPADSDKSIPLKQRWDNSRHLAKWMNEQKLDDNNQLVELKSDLEKYFNKLKNLKTEEKYVFQLAENKNPLSFAKILGMILGIPFSILAMIHFYLPYRIIKNFVEKTFKRRVFWSSVKMILGGFAMAIWNIPIVILMYHFIFKPLFGQQIENLLLLTWLYYFIIPIFGVIAYKSFRIIENVKKLKALKRSNFQQLVEERSSLIQRIKTFYF